MSHSVSGAGARGGFRLILGLWRLWLDPSVALMPRGYIVLSWCIQKFSLSSLSLRAVSDLGCARMSSNICMFMSEGGVSWLAKV